MADAIAELRWLLLGVRFLVALSNMAEYRGFQEKAR
jgi:hypothetical protein